MKNEKHPIPGNPHLPQAFQRLKPRTLISCQEIRRYDGHREWGEIHDSLADTQELLEALPVARLWIQAGSQGEHWWDWEFQFILDSEEHQAMFRGMKNLQALKSRDEGNAEKRPGIEEAERLHIQHSNHYGNDQEITELGDSHLDVHVVTPLGSRIWLKFLELVQAGKASEVNSQYGRETNLFEEYEKFDRILRKALKDRSEDLATNFFGFGDPQDSSQRRDADQEDFRRDETHRNLDPLGSEA